MSNQVDVLIVGAGITGLMAANRLHAAGKRVLVVDKGAGVGGRMATRRIGPGRADHGAQFFTVRTAEFQQHVTQWRAQGLVFVWSHGWSDGSLVGTKSDGYPRYAVHTGMTAVPKHLAQGLDVRTGVKICRIVQEHDRWQAIDEVGNQYTGAALMLTSPVPQSLALLAAGDVTLHAADHAALARIAYAPCLCGLFWVKGKVHLPEPGALQRPLARISWIADNQRKGISPDATLVTVHGGPLFSQGNFDEPEAVVMDKLQAVLKRHLGDVATIEAAQYNRWRYALPTTLHPERFLQAQTMSPLLFAGDAFKEPRIEGAALSGLAAAGALLEY
ncbi:MAG: FAD-dependent oxidoreductase [Anaerolinea sp.]|nr:FAD-dependent oxidoreductase [Anaerolinea sp.]